jgi:hypothetical protein
LNKEIDREGMGRIYKNDENGNRERRRRESEREKE